MTTLLHILGTCAVLAASGVFLLCLSKPIRDDPFLEEIRSHPGVIQTFTAQGSGARSDLPEAPPLVVQAEAFARLLNPRGGAEVSLVREMPVGSAEIKMLIRPAAPLARFRIHGTSCYPSQPGRSMALISDAGAPEGCERWVKEGSQIGHFVIHEIRPNGITYRDGDQLREMAVETVAGPTSIVRDVRSGSRRVSAAVEDVGHAVSIPAGPNSIEISGN
jgi:hypothetical protein